MGFRPHRQSYVLQVPITIDQLESIKQQADERKLTLAAFVRSVVFSPTFRRETGRVESIEEIAA